MMANKYNETNDKHTHKTNQKINDDETANDNDHHKHSMISNDEAETKKQFFFLLV